MDKIVRDGLIGICREHGGRVVFDAPLRSLSKIGIGGKAAAWLEPSGLEALTAARSLLDGKGMRTIVIGNASNVLFPDGDMDAVVITLSSRPFRTTRFGGRTVTAGAGVELTGLISDCCERGLSGLEGLVGVPATVGGAVMTNAGYRSSISDHLVKVRCLDGNGNMTWMDRGAIEFGYRSCSLDKKWIVVEAVFRLQKAAPQMLRERVKEYFLEKMSRQPLDKRTLGCVFKNPGDTERGSSELIDLARMKGATQGGAQVSEKHANFIVNLGNASSGDVVRLMEKMKREVLKKFSVELESEIEILS